MTMITPSYLGETIEYSSLHACRSTLEDPTQTRNSAAVRAVVEASHHNDAIEQAYGAMIEAFVAITARTIQGGIDAGELGPLDAPEVARALVRMLNGYLVDPRRSQDPDRALEVVWTVWTRTLHPGSRES